jgi:aryl-alcohol dehydrogenase-like predicted oxidoreductase
MSTPAAKVPLRTMAGTVAVPRLIKGGWQLAGGHSAGTTVDQRAAVADMMAFAEAGITAFDCADIYTGVETLIGEFLRQWRRKHGSAAPAIRVHTKCVPDRDVLPSLTRQQVTALVDRSLQRLGVEQLDLVQLHWWDYAVPGWLDAAGWLTELQAAGKLRAVGLTNFDTPHVQALCDAGLPIASHQVQCSLLDRRALGAMARLCAAQDIVIFSYGALAGGFFHERWLGAAEPQPPFANRSLIKYQLIIEEFGGWERFQELLQLLHRIAQAHDTSLGAVALRAALDEPAVTSVIVGARSATHLEATLQALDITLRSDERTAIDTLIQAALGPRGDVYELERDPTSAHAGIMRYNLNRQSHEP